MTHDLTMSERKCLVLLPYTDFCQRLYAEALQPAIRAANFTVLRPDEMPGGKLVAANLWEAIQTCDAVVADITGCNPNVMYELGLAHAAAKPTILITGEPEERLPFDVRHLQVFRYSHDMRSTDIFCRQVQKALTSIAREFDMRVSGAGGQLPLDHEQATRLLAAADAAISAGRPSDAIPLYEQAVQQFRRLQDLGELATALTHLGSAYQNLGSYDRARITLQEALDVVRRGGFRSGEAATYANLANVYGSQGDVEQATELYERALRLTEEFGDQRGLASVLSNLASLRVQQARYAEAEPLLRRALAISEELGNERAVAASCANMGTLMEAQGRFDEALELFRRSVAIFESASDSAGLARVWHNIASVEMERRNYHAAEELLRKSLAAKEAIGDVHGKASTLNSLASVHLAMGRIAEGVSLLTQAAQLHEQIGDQYGLMRTYENLSQVLAAAGHPSDAETLLRKSVALARRLGAPETPVLVERLGKLASSKSRGE